MIEEVIETFGNYTVIHKIPKYSPEEKEQIDKRILQKLDSIISKG